ncbi:hypothetical protein GCM10010840_18150 [Deinococcus aerolatus]|uniref:histidine kinase n=1 Tax=Deinococcus aerolatus TaxID=522487 RepID=A0ABQ2G8U3_9DEIO|nr:GAF domain-containing protein [Deinococcus aerolatus]GGL80710.1 hypothetical protein GCM10010840_18150 [Deinococcus aerolatus]
MTDLSNPDPALAAHLLNRLQRVTQDLAAVRRTGEVFDIVLRDALDALAAIDGTVLLVQGKHLNVAARLGQAQSSVWQDRDLDGPGPAADALRQDTPLFFESAGALVAAYPALETRTGGVAAVASAVLPMVMDGHPLGVIVLDFREPHTFTLEEQHFLQTLASQCALALDRARLSGDLEQQVHDRTAELEAFVRFTETADGETGVLVLAERAVAVLSTLFPGCTTAYHALEDGLWRIKVHTSDLEKQPTLLASLQAGVPMDIPVFAQPMRTGQPIFVDDWNPEQQHFPYTEVYQSAAIAPLPIGGVTQAMFVLGVKDTPHWTEHRRAVFQAVGRSLTLALERTEVARQLEVQNAELLARTQALEGFAALTRDLGLTTDADVLIERAMSLVLSLLPPGYAVFWQVSEGQWRIRAQLGELGNPALQVAVDAGLPVGQTPTLDQPHQTREPLFQDRYDLTRDIAPELVTHLFTVATLPVLVGGAVTGIFNVSLFGPRPWSVADQAVLKSTVFSLGLALERAEQARQLTAQRDLLQASNEELEAFTYSVSHDLRTPVRHITSFGELLRRALPEPLDPKAERYFGIVTQAATTLATLIDGMLDVSRASRQPLKLERVDLNRIFGAARQQMDVTHPGREIVWEIAVLPEIYGDVELLRRVVTALLDNAVKYTRDRRPAVIAVWAEDQGERWAVRVRDNGVGFNPEYVGKLFTMFQRLHRQEDFGGAAVSLANARRIVTRHGGTMMAEGQPDEGATFSFVLPKAAL